MILETMTGELSVQDACQQLGIERSHFQDLRQRALAGAAAALEPQQPGRKPATVTVTPQELEQLRREKTELEDQLIAIQAGFEVALAMPRLLRPRKGGS